MSRELRLLRPLWLMSLLICGLPLPAQVGGRPVGGYNGGMDSSQSNQGPRALRGQVVNSITGEPIPRALVQLGPQFATLTDHEGRFAFENVTAGQIPMAVKPGYFAENGTSFMSRISARPEDEIILKLVPEAILSGTVVGQDGFPLEGMQVQLKMLTVSEGIERWTERQQTRTNSEGQYRFAELEAGKYQVASGFQMDGLPDAQSSVGYMPVRYPAAGAGEVASAIALSSGEHTEANLTPAIERLYLVSGTLVGFNARSGITFEIQSADGEDISSMSRFDPRSGEFRLVLPSGSFQLKATAYSPTGTMAARRALTVPKSPVYGISLALEPYATVPVEIDAETVNRPATGSETVQPPTAVLYLLSPDPRFPFQQLYATPGGQADARGATSGVGARVIENVPPGRYVLHNLPQSPWYVSSAMCGGVNLMREQLMIAGSAAGCSIHVVLRNDPGSIHVSVRNSGTEPSEKQVFVYLIPLDNLVQQSQMLVGRESSAEGVAPGRYLALALDHFRELAYRNPEALQRYAQLGQQITVTSNGKTDVDVSLVNGEP